MECYSVKAMFGHVGRNNSIVKEIATYAENGKEAAFNVRWMGRVKHNLKNAIIEVKKISEERYHEIQEANKKDPYFSCHSKQEQKALCTDIANEIISLKQEDLKNRNEERKNKVTFMKKKQKQQLNDAYYEMHNYNEYIWEGAM